MSYASASGPDGVMNLEYVCRPTIVPPDSILCRGEIALIRKIRRFSPGQHDHSPIVNTLWAVEYVTDRGSRWFGAHEVTS